MSTWFQAYGYEAVLDDLLVGAYPTDADDVRVLDSLRVRRVLNLVRDEEYEPGQREAVAEAYAAAGIEEHRSAFTDFGRLPAAELEVTVQEVLAWVRAGVRSYLHCRAGWQRSAAVAAGVVALLEEIELDAALELVEERKPQADPLPEQREDLRRWWETRASPRSGPGDF